MILEYSPACGLLGALRSKAFTDEDVKNLEGRSFIQTREYLKGFVEDEVLENTRNVQDIEKILFWLYVQRVSKLVKFLGKRPAGILRILLYEIDIMNIRIFARVLHLVLDIMGVKHLVYTESPFLIFKASDLAAIHTFGDLEKVVERDPALLDFYLGAREEFAFHKDIFYFDAALEKKYCSYLLDVSQGLGDDCRRLLELWVGVKLLIYSLRLKFLQKKPAEEINYVLSFSRLFPEKFFQDVLAQDSLSGALRTVEDNIAYRKFRLILSGDFEEELNGWFYGNFLRKRKHTFFDLYPYLSFCLNQRFLTDKLVFVINGAGV